MGSFCNDLTVDPDGNLYATDSTANMIVRVPAAALMTPGSAEVWSADPAYAVPPPGGFGLNVSMRRSVRTGERAGIPVEGLGVNADVLYRQTVEDLFNKNIGLLEFTSAHLESEVRHA